MISRKLIFNTQKSRFVRAKREDLCLIVVPNMRGAIFMDRSNKVLEVPSEHYGRLKNYINGKWIDSESKQIRDIINPATNEVIAHVPLSTPDEVDKAISAAKESFESWREVPPVIRARYFFALKNLMEEHFEDLSRTLVQEMGKTIAEARGELRRSIEEVEVACGIPALMQGY
ncbi:MAG: aldehyde dehydrogenase family protein, partial [Nitrospirota bacterium]